MKCRPIMIIASSLHGHQNIKNEVRCVTNYHQKHQVYNSAGGRTILRGGGRFGCSLVYLCQLACLGMLSMTANMDDLPGELESDVRFNSASVSVNQVQKLGIRARRCR